MAIVTTVNPATGKEIKQYQLLNDQQVTKILEQKKQAFCLWANLSYKKRAELLYKVADLLKQRAEEYARLITTEMGKPISQARQEVNKCAWVCEHYADHAEHYLENKLIETDYKKSYITYKPLGTIFAIMPWNYPFWQVFRFAAPTLMAGNAIVLKHADICTGTGQAIEQLFRDAGAPEYLFNSLVIDHEQAADVIAHQNIAAVTLTGSEQAGGAVGAAAAKNLKKVVLELGGNDPYIILEDADLDHAANICLKSRLNNTGQVCIAAKRFIVVEKNAKKFKQLILDKIQDYQFGDPLDEKTNLGPLARQDLKEGLLKQVEQSIKLGAVNLLKNSDNFNQFNKQNPKGFYFPIIVLDNVKPDMPAYHQELFGPVICLITAKDEKDAIDIANDSRYGLASAIFTDNLAKAEDIAVNKLQTGTVAINNLVSSDPRLPFGGIKSSGYGRELGGEGILEFVNIKTITM